MSNAVSWEFLLTLDYGTRDQLPAEVAMDLVRHCLAADAFQMMPRRLVVRDGKAIVAEQTITTGRGVSSAGKEFLRDLPHTYRDHRYSFEIIYALPLFVQLFEDDLPSKRLFARRLIVRGRRRGSAKPPAVIYMAGDARHYRSGRTRDLNLSLLLDELAAFADMGARSIRGFNVHNDLEPHRQVIVYHHRLDAYFIDLHSATGEHYSATDHNRFIMLDAILSEEADVRYIDTHDFPIICSQRGTSGDLRLFYTRMLQLLQLNGDRPDTLMNPDEA